MLSRWHEDLAAHDEAFACLQDLLDPSSFCNHSRQGLPGMGPGAVAAWPRRSSGRMPRSSGRTRPCGTASPELERSAALDSTTSSKPPASDGLRKKSGTQRRTRSQRGKSATPSGGQPGPQGNDAGADREPGPCCGS